MLIAFSGIARFSDSILFPLQEHKKEETEGQNKNMYTEIRPLEEGTIVI